MRGEAAERKKGSERERDRDRERDSPLKWILVTPEMTARTRVEKD